MKIMQSLHNDNTVLMCMHLESSFKVSEAKTDKTKTQNKNPDNTEKQH